MPLLQPGTAVPSSPPNASSRSAYNLPPTKKKTSPMFLLTLAAIVVCILIGFARMATTPKADATVRIVCAAKDIPPGCKIGFSSLHYMQIPKQYHSDKMFTSYEQLVGKYTRTFVSAREPFVSQELILNGQGLAGELPKGARAFTLKLTDDALVDMQLRPGDRVDVVATTPYKTKKYTKTVAEDVIILLALPKESILSEKFSSQESNKVTLAVTPQQAEVLSQALEESKLRLSLRSYGDLSRIALFGADERDLLPHDALREEPPKKDLEESVAPPALQPPPPPPLPGLPEVVQEPVRWVVDMFSGSRLDKKEIEQRSN